MSAHRLRMGRATARTVGIGAAGVAAALPASVQYE
jgi:hypothetical protein